MKVLSEPNFCVVYAAQATPADPSCSWHDQLFTFKLGLDAYCLTLTSDFAWSPYMRPVMLSWHDHLSKLGLDMDCLMLAYILYGVQATAEDPSCSPGMTSFLLLN